MTNGEVPNPSITEVTAAVKPSGNDQALGGLGVAESVGAETAQGGGDASVSSPSADAPVTPISWFTREPRYKNEGKG